VIDVVQIDPHHEAAFDQWFAVLHETDLERWPDKPGWQRAERLAMALDEEGPEEHRCLMARNDTGGVVGIGDLETFRRENRHVARLDVRVRAAYRRQGVGSAIVGQASALAAAGGRTELGGMDQTPARPGYVTAGAPFARHLGFTVALRMVLRELALPLAPPRLEALRTHPKSAVPGYALLTFGDRWPDRYLADRCLLGRRMSTDTPVGEQELDEETWDEARVRQIEAGLAAQDRARVTTAALHEDSGHLAGFTEVVVPRGAPQSAWQHDTLVLREHRGHGLGFAMKVANVEAVMDAHPAVRSISTWNAAENQHMIAVNEEMGFVVAAHADYWLKQLGPA
jgi:GNAT superfamily N-acetyltransferase